jgi:hypothetical protein
VENPINNFFLDKVGLLSAHMFHPNINSQNYISSFIEKQRGFVRIIAVHLWLLDAMAIPW